MSGFRQRSLTTLWSSVPLGGDMTSRISQGTFWCNILIDDCAVLVSFRTMFLCYIWELNFVICMFETL